MKIKLSAVSCIALVLLAGCVDDTSLVTADPDVPLSDVDACEVAVASQTGNSQVRTLSTRSSEANNTVIVGVGPDQAQWQCLVKNGSVAGVMSLTNEGTL
jgi:hypothetical protein